METSYFRAVVAYDGTEFLGFQWQRSGRTVQGVLEKALKQVTQAAVRVIAAGRTDTGVHAWGQVIGFRVAWRHPIEELHRALNAVLPADVAVLDLAPAPEGWHPRFSAVWRRYRYTVLNGPWRSPLERRYAHQMAEPLDLAALQAAAALTVGTHDFASFGQPMRGETTVREVFSAGWQQLPGEAVGWWGDLGDGVAGARGRSWFIFEITGNAFLRGMVRRLVAAMLRVGTGFWSTEDLAALLAGRDLSLAPPPAPACGLCLMQVEYAEGVRTRENL